MRLPSVLGAAVAACAAAIFAAAPASAADVDSTSPGFVTETYATGFDEPVAMAFAPDGRLFVAEKGGTIWVVANGRRSEQPFATVEVLNFLESGLIGLTVSPDFVFDRHVYIFATVSIEEQNIIRFTDVNGVGMERTVVRRNLPSAGTFHNGGGLAFGPDGMLYFSVGDNTIGELAQDVTTLAGKICRINRDGSSPPDNPLATPTGSPRAVYASGFRNPFRFCFAPDGRMFAIDVGSDGLQRREEINAVRAGMNGGWPMVEGLDTSGDHPAFTNPAFAYHDKGSSPTGIVFYASGAYPAEYEGNLFQLEYALNRIYRIVVDGDSVVSHSMFLQVDGGPVDLVLGPDGFLYYSELITGRVSRVRYAEGGVDGETGGEPSPPTSACGITLGPVLLLLTGLHIARCGRRRGGTS